MGKTLVQRAIKGVPPVWEPREDEGTQLANALIDLANAPRGGVFSCKWHPELRTTWWGYAWYEANGCRSAICGGVNTHTKHILTELVEVDEIDRYVNLDPCYDRWERNVQSATGDSVYRTNEFEL